MQFSTELQQGIVFTLSITGAIASISSFIFAMIFADIKKLPELKKEYEFNELSRLISDLYIQIRHFYIFYIYKYYSYNLLEEIPEDKIHLNHIVLAGRLKRLYNLIEDEKEDYNSLFYSLKKETVILFSGIIVFLFIYWITDKSIVFLIGVLALSSSLISIIYTKVKLLRARKEKIMNIINEYTKKFEELDKKYNKLLEKNYEEFEKWIKRNRDDVHI